jgi:GDP-4-dehydro-6-deoxy-D-mannose reductase
MRILTTGVTGFVGGHLTELLTSEGGHTLAGLSRRGRWPAEWAHLAGTTDLHSADLLDGPAVERVVGDFAPDWVVHLAAYANPGRSFTESEICWRSNLDATRSLYEAVLRAGLKPRILFVSTGLVYGDPDAAGTAFTETSPLRPASPYAASKAAADLLSYQVTRASGLPVVCVRLFNQTGPRQTPDYAVPNFARQLAEIAAGRRGPEMTVGDLSGSRDFTDVRDVVAGFRMLIERGTPGEVYNAGSGVARKMQDVLDELIELSGTCVSVTRTLDPNRRADTAVTRADAGKLRAATGWTPGVPFRQTLKDTLDYWHTVTASSDLRS